MILLAVSMRVGIVVAQQELPDAPSATKGMTVAPKPARADTPKPTRTDSGWPRTFTAESDHFSVYQPQVEKWDGNIIDLYSAVEAKKGNDTSAKYGVVWVQARTEVDKVNRLVTLDQVKITSVKFPAAPEREPVLMNLLQKKLPGATRTVSLDRLQAAVDLDNEVIKTVEVKNDPPEIIVASTPSLLVLVDGAAQMRELPGTKLQQVINTKSTILFSPESKLYFLRLENWWMQANELQAPWKKVEKLPEEMKQTEQMLAGQSVAQNAEAKPPEQLAAAKDPIKKAETPTVYVMFKPTELIETEGDPKYERIPGTGLEYVVNTSANIFRLNQEYYVVVSGRWFKCVSLDGPWTFVNGKELPADFAKIPSENPKSTVLATVPDTPQSREALIANSIPQTATITRSEAKLTVKYDGDPTFVPIEGTSLQYAKNTSAPVIKIADRYYCVEAGVWFEAASPQGPWRVADSVPAEVYNIPPSSPLHYVTYVKVYSSTPEVVYVGYTPGYYGTVVSSSSMTVVYGTGWYYPPYIGPTVWYGWPYTYGVGAGFTYTTDSGWSFGFGYGYTYYYPWYYPWWGPMGYYGCCWYPYYGWGAWGGAAAANVYGMWGNTAYSRTGAAWANPYTGNYGAATRGAYHNTQTGRVTAAGRGYNTNIYTGNTGGYRGAATYNPNTGIVAGAGAGYVGNIYSGQGAAGRGGFAYNTNTNAGVAAGKNNVYAGKDGTVYRYNRNNGNWSSNSGSGWQQVDRPEPKMQNQFEMRNQGAQRTQNFSSMRSSGGTRMRGGGRRR
jgi:hypothetical protein